MDLENGIVGWDSQDDPLNPRYVNAFVLMLWMTVLSNYKEITLRRENGFFSH